jgi:ComF family protein
MFRAFLDLIFPRTCVACRQPLTIGEEQLCTFCLHDLPKTHSHNGHYPILEKKTQGLIPVNGVIAYLKFGKGGKVQRIIHSLKYKGNQDIGKKLGSYFGAELNEAQWNKAIDLIVPVPLHPKRQKERGYNQCTAFGEAIAERMNIRFSEEVLKRGKETQTQTRKTRMERFENMQDIFFVENPDILKGKSVAIVDDVITTGATLMSCAEVLLQNGAKEVSFIALAAAE